MDQHRSGERRQGAFLVRLVTDLTLPHAFAEELERFFALVPGPIHVRLERPRLPALQTTVDGDLAWAHIFDTLRQLREQHAWDAADLACLVTSTANEYNWFSANELQHREMAGLTPVFLTDPTATANFFIHADDFSWITSASRVLVAAQRLVKKVLDHVLELAGQRIEMHQKSLGCLFDFCEDKTDLRLKLQSAAICGDCLSRLESLPGYEPLLRQVVEILERCRLDALPTARYLARPFPDGIWRWPYPVAVTAHLVERTDEPVTQFMRQLDHFDSLVRYTTIIVRVWHGQSVGVPPRPSLGHWVGELGMAGRENKIEAIETTVRVIQQQRLVNLRNEWRGHGHVRRDAECYSEVRAQLSCALRQIEASLEPLLRQYMLVLYNGQGSTSAAGDAFEFRGLQLMGSNTIFPIWRFATTENPLALGIRSDSIMLTDVPYSRFVSMRPYLVRDRCPECVLDRILIWDGELYLDVHEGHRVRLVSSGVPGPVCG